MVRLPQPQLHALKAGITLQQGYREYTQAYNQNVTRSVNNNAAGQLVPVSLTEYASPYEYDMNLDANLGVFAQDQWTLKRLTANIGLRFDYQHESTPAQNPSATYFLPARSYPAVSPAADWKDLDPRVGLSYDLFGNGKTALKGSISRFVGGETIGMAAALNPVNTSVNSVTRPWTSDPSGTLNPFLDCTLINPGANGSCGAITNASFGTPNIATTFAPNLYSPSLLYCDIKPPFQPQVKFLGTVGLPWKFSLSGVFQTIPGPQILASESLSKAQGLTATTLGRQFFESTYTIPLIAPGTRYGDRVYQVDFRLSKAVPLGHGSMRGNVNLYNIMNANPVLIQNNTYGQAWQQPNAVLTGRLLRFDATIDF